MTRTSGAAPRRARSTMAWKRNDTSPAARTAAPMAGQVDQPRSARSTKAMYAADVPLAPCAKFTRPEPDRKSVVEGKRVSVRVDLGGRRRITIKKNKNKKSILN